MMLDSHLAELYGVKAIRLREQVRRNRTRFPPDFMFQLTPEEADALVTQNAIPSRKHMGGHLPFVYTQEGVAAQITSILDAIKKLMDPPLPPPRRKSSTKGGLSCFPPSKLLE